MQTKNYFEIFFKKYVLTFVLLNDKMQSRRYIMGFSQEEIELIKKQKIEYKSAKAKLDNKFTVFFEYV